MSKNLIFITTDQQRFDSLRAYGFNKAITPNIDRLCEEGTVFENCYVAAPVCVACRSALMTGLFPSVTGTIGNSGWIDNNVPTWPGQLSRNGVYTAGIGKMHFAPWDTLSGFDMRIICEDKRHSYIDDDHAKFLKANGLKRPHPATFPLYNETIGAPFYPYDKRFYPDVFIADQAVQWLDSNANHPFAVWVSFLGPHDPYDPPKECDTIYKVEDMPYPIPPPENPHDKSAYQLAQEERPGKNNSMFQCDYLSATEEQMRYWRKNYMTNISIIDEGVGKIISKLEEKGILDETTIIFTSDHGDSLGDHGTVFKCYFYESMVHVPLIMRGPSIPVGERRSQLISSCDFVPFFFDVLNKPINMITQGRSINKILNDNYSRLHDVVFSEMFGWYMVFDGRYKYSYYVGRPHEMYDLAIDPNELDNIVALPEYAGICDRLIEKLMEHMNECVMQRTRLAKKVASEKRSIIDADYLAGIDVKNNEY